MWKLDKTYTKQKKKQMRKFPGKAHWDVKVNFFFFFCDQGLTASGNIDKYRLP